jgi:uncharacterized protein
MEGCGVIFRSPTQGVLTLEEVASRIIAQRQADSDGDYRLIIGTDSQLSLYRSEATFVTAVILHRVGHGAHYYIHKEHHTHMHSLRQRMFAEASLSLQTSGLLMEQLASAGDWAIEVHLDVGERGETRQWANELVSWIQNNGYEARIKPDSFGASTVADRYTKH